MPHDWYRVLVTGSRDWTDRATIYRALDAIAAQHPDLIIVHGAARGADAMADTWAKDYGFPVECHPANWNRYGRAAGFRRNAEMVALGANLCLAFVRNGSRGATHCATLAERSGIRVEWHEVREDGTRGH